MAAVKGVAADAVADYLRSADVYQVQLTPLHHAPMGKPLFQVSRGGRVKPDGKGACRRMDGLLQGGSVTGQNVKPIVLLCCSLTCWRRRPSSSWRRMRRARRCTSS